jgi:vacuolar-type H+-ATPase subunit F/Vma7
LRVVCRPASQEGFALAGVRALPARDARECGPLLEALVEESESGVLLVEDALYRELSDELRERLERRAVPVVVPFPGPRGEEGPATEVELVEMLRRAIGYRVRLR